MRRLMSALGKRVWRTPIPHLVPVRLRSGGDLLFSFTDNRVPIPRDKCADTEKHDTSCQRNDAGWR